MTVLTLVGSGARRQDCQHCGGPARAVPGVERGDGVHVWPHQGASHCTTPCLGRVLYGRLSASGMIQLQAAQWECW